MIPDWSCKNCSHRLDGHDINTCYNELMSESRLVGRCMIVTCQVFPEIVITECRCAKYSRLSNLEYLENRYDHVSV
jgi:hypothetical protein